MKSRLISQDGQTGLMFLAVGLFFGAKTLTGLPLGTLEEMGPGYFPLVLCAILCLLGLAVLAKAKPDAESPRAISLRSLVLIVSGPVAFGLAVRSLGLAPALIITVTLAVLASPRFRPARAIAIVLGVTLFCVAVFKWGIGVPYHLVNPVLLQ